MRENIRLDSRRFALWTALLFFTACGLSGCSMGSTNAATRGRELFQNCAPCHQPDGSGNAEIGAANIAGMKAWYVQEELDKFRAGARGRNFSDVEGLRMGPIAASLLNEDDVKLVAAYVETMPPVRHAPALPGDAQA